MPSHNVIRRITNVLAIAIAIGVLVYFDANLFTLFKLTLACCWFVILPGTLLLHRFLKKPLQSLETWIIGTALGLNFFPVLFTVGGFFTDAGNSIWLVVSIIISFFNLIALYGSEVKGIYVKREQGSQVSLSIPFSAIVIVCFIFLAAFQFQQFGRDVSKGVYYFSVYFGGDIPNQSAYVERFLISPTLIDWHTNGAITYHHDFSFRFLAGLYNQVGGDIYDTTWFWIEPFSYLLLLSFAWLLVKRFTRDSLAAWIALVALLLGGGRMYTFYTTVSDSFRLSIVQALLLLYLITEFHTQPNASSKKLAAALFLFVAIASPRWKVTLSMVLFPALILGELFYARKSKNWKGMWVVLTGFGLALIHTALVFSRAQAIAGEPVLGRPLHDLERFIETISFHLIHPLPVTPLSGITLTAVLSILFLLPFHFIRLLAVDGRFGLATAVLPWSRTKYYDLPYLQIFVTSIAIIGYIVAVIQSPMHYFYGDYYQPLLGSLLSLLGISSLVAMAVRMIRTRSIHTKREWIFCLLVIWFVGVDIIQSVHGFSFVWHNERGTLPIALTTELEQAAQFIPDTAKVITRRFDLTGPATDHHLALHERKNGEYHDRNFEFYATALRRTVVQEGPDDNLVRAAALAETDSTQYLFPNEPLRNDLFHRVALLDSIYDSHDSEHVRQAADELNARYIIIDKTIDQRIMAKTASSLDTLFNGKTTTLLCFRK